MNQLIKITTNENGEQAVSAKTLYSFLTDNDKTHYLRWVKNNILDNKYAIENEEYALVASVATESGRGHYATDYALTIDFAKKLAMLSHTEKGEQARDYFINCEKQLKQVPQQIAQTQLSSQIAAAEMRSMANYKAALLGFIDGLKPDVAEVRTIKHLRPKLTQIDCDDMLTLIPGRTNIDDIGYYTPTTLGENVGNKSAQVINQALADLGFQTKTNKIWKLTEAGTDYGEMLPWENHGRAGFKISWNEKALEKLKKYFNINV